MDCFSRFFQRANALTFELEIEEAIKVSLNLCTHRIDILDGEHEVSHVEKLLNIELSLIGHKINSRHQLTLRVQMLHCREQNSYIANVLFKVVRILNVSFVIPQDSRTCAHVQIKDVGDTQRVVRKDL